MPIYGYDCARCGAFDLVRPMTQAGEPALCPRCGEPGRRTWGAPALRSGDLALVRALDASAASADAPAVVDCIPCGPRTRTAIDPRHLLPRP